MQNVVRRALARADAGLNHLYGWRCNPLYHSGALVLALFVVLLVTGVYLLFFYHISAPYESIVAIDRQVWLGRWMRGVHRYASDAAVVAGVFHALRMLVQGRSWGPRTLAWVSGLVLLAFVFICGWTGFVMVWDVQGQVLAAAGARLFDLVPIFGEPISRAFTGERPIPGAFFFLNLFAHVALPIGLFILVWVHVSRLARPGLFPPRRLTWTVVGGLTALAVLWPVTATPPADLFALPGAAPFDWFYAFWIPLARSVPPGVLWGIGLAVAMIGLAIPWLSRPRAARRLPTSKVDERLCTGCEQCYLDCPYEAIAMVERADAAATGKSTLVARVDPALCTSCGLCAGSCAPMGVGPAGRTGRAQLGTVRDFVAVRRPGARDVVLVACERGAGGVAAREVDGAPVYPVSCGGNLHTSVVEFLLRSGAGGVLIVSCPPRDCWHREGPKWLEARLFHEREAELRDRVDRRRVRLVYASAAERGVVRAALAAFRAEVATLDAAAADADVDLERLCELVEANAEQSG
ncbi:MAG TPA: hydrogenase iron-sulfur subunit [Gemmatimonadales bacterium]|nr:hydrogenase iron-sulfur subunit [Gemmatimonadales bacterium]